MVIILMQKIIVMYWTAQDKFRFVNAIYHTNSYLIYNLLYTNSCFPYLSVAKLVEYN